MAGKTYLTVWVLAFMMVIFSNASAQEKSEFPYVEAQTQNSTDGGNKLQAILGVSHEGWMQLGPEGGDARSIVMSTEDHNTLYCLAYGNPSSIFRTTSGGLIWGRISKIDQFVNTLAIDPYDAHTLYAAGEGWYVYKSPDYGLTWVTHQLETDPAVVINEISVSPIANNVIYAVGHCLDLTSVISVYRSIDAGATWNKYEIAKTDTGYGYGLCIALDPGNRDIVYVGGYHYDGFSRKGVLYRSINGGNDWTDIYSGISGLVYDIAIHPYSPQKLFVATPFGIYSSSNSGLSWTKNKGNLWAFRLAVDPIYPGIIYGGAYESVYRSIDGGINWTEHRIEYSGNCNSLLVDHTNNENIYYGGSRSIYKSIDSAENWTAIDSGFAASTVTTIAIAPTTPNTIYIGYPGKGLFKSLNSGNSWFQLPSFVSSTNIAEVAVDPLSPGVVYALEGSGPGPCFLSKSEDGGQTWRQIDTYFDDGGAIYVDPYSANTVYVAGTRLERPKVMAVARSTDGGSSWERFEISGTEGMGQALAFDPTNDAAVYVGGWCYIGSSKVGKVYKSINGGINWIDISSGLESIGNEVTTLAVNPLSPATIFAGASDGLFKSEDGGITWLEVGCFDSVCSIVIDPDSPRIMYLATTGTGVYRSTDWGDNWRPINRGLISKRVKCLAFNPAGELLYAGTEYAGSFRIETGEGRDITGCVSYYSNNAPVDAVIIRSDSIYVDTSDANGYYELLNLPTDTIVVRPDKTNAIGGAINAMDVAFILEHYVGLISLNPYQKIAADVSGDKSITPHDAALILKFGVGKIKKFPIMPDTSHFWKFVPQAGDIDWKFPIDSIAYKPLDRNMYDQDYYGIIFGDVTGNWPGVSQQLAAKERSLSKTIAIKPKLSHKIEDNRLLASLHVDNELEIMAMSFTLKYDPTILKALEATATKLTEDFLFAYNVEQNQVKVALAGSRAITDSGSMVNLEFEVLKPELLETNSPINISDVMINEGKVSVNVQSTKFTMGTPLPKEYALSQNYPNPFNPATIINYQLPRDSHVYLKIFNLLGQQICTLVDEQKEAGYHQVKWDGKDVSGREVASGVYLYSIEAGDFRMTKKMVKME